MENNLGQLPCGCKWASKDERFIIIAPDHSWDITQWHDEKLHDNFLNSLLEIKQGSRFSPK